MKKIFAVLPLLALIFTAGCVPGELYLHPLPENPRSPAVIAAFLPLSGKNRIYAEQMQEGLIFAESRINNNNGINGRPVKVHFLDTGGTAAGADRAIAEARRLNAVAAIAGYSTIEVSDLIRHASAVQMPMLIPMATSDHHLQVSPFVYRNSFSDTQQMEVLANYLIHWRKAESGSIITDYAGDREYARGISRNFAQSVTDIGGEIFSSVNIEPDEEITREQLIKALSANPRFIMVVSRGKRAAGLIKKLRESGFRGVICGPDTMDDSVFISALAGSEPGECIFTAFFDPENDSREYQTFRTDFRKRFFHNPGACEAQSYDALIFLCIALSNAEHIFEFDRNWQTIRNHNGAAALYSGRPKGGIDRTVYLKSLGVDRSSGKPVPYPRLSKQLQYSDLKDYQIIE